MKSQDIVILLKLISLQKSREGERYLSFRDFSDIYSARALEASLGISKTEIHASINRSIRSGIAIQDRTHRSPRPNLKALCDFITAGIKYVYPAATGGLTRGLPTAFAAPSLKSLLLSAGEFIYVWPDARESQRGISVQPLFKSVPKAVKDDPLLYEYLALIDAIRLGNPRESNLAIDLLRERLNANEQK